MSLESLSSKSELSFQSMTVGTGDGEAARVSTGTKER